MLLRKSVGKHFHNLESDRYLGVRGKEGDVCVCVCACGGGVSFFFSKKSLKSLFWFCQDKELS